MGLRSFMPQRTEEIGSGVQGLRSGLDKSETHESGTRSRVGGNRFSNRRFFCKNPRRYSNPLRPSMRAKTTERRKRSTAVVRNRRDRVAPTKEPVAGILGKGTIHDRRRYLEGMVLSRPDLFSAGRSVTRDRRRAGFVVTAD